MKNLMTLLVTCALAMTACSATETKGKIGSPAPALSGMTWIQGGPVEIKKGARLDPHDVRCFGLLARPGLPVGTGALVSQYPQVAALSDSALAIPASRI